MQHTQPACGGVQPLSEVLLGLCGPLPERAAGEKLLLPPLASPVREAHPEPCAQPAPRPAVDGATLAALRLHGDEPKLVQACERALRLGLDHVALMCRVTRVSPQAVLVHAREIGVAGRLTVHMIQNVRRFAHFVRLLKELQVLHFEDALPGRTLLGHGLVRVLDEGAWQAVLHEVCAGDGFFKAKSSIYEMWLCFGFGFAKGLSAHKFARPKPARSTDKTDTPVPATSTDKKIAALMYSATLTFCAETLQRNLKRYTNQHVRKQPFAGLTALLAAARNVDRQSRFE